jgi:hypothetical protein
MLLIFKLPVVSKDQNISPSVVSALFLLHLCISYLLHLSSNLFQRRGHNYYYILSDFKIGITNGENLVSG